MANASYFNFSLMNTDNTQRHWEIFLQVCVCAHVEAFQTHEYDFAINTDVFFWNLFTKSSATGKPGSCLVLDYYMDNMPQCSAMRN